MNDNLLNATPEDVDVVIIEDIEVEDTEQDIQTVETVDPIEVETPEEIDITMDEAIGWATGDPTIHGNLGGRDADKQHPIKAIEGLRPELEEIKSLQTVYSDKIGFANYYQWNNSSLRGAGYFVSMVPETDTIAICDGKEIFGVTVESSGFIGGQDEAIVETDDGSAPKHVFTRDESYALVVTTGVVDVRCESDIIVGDYVVSNAFGEAQKTASGYGYKVIAVNKEFGPTYVTISLGIQACVTNKIGLDLQQLTTRVRNNEINIASVMSISNDAYNRAIESILANKLLEDKMTDMSNKFDDMSTNIDLIGAQMGDLTSDYAQLKELAESIRADAEKMAQEAIDLSNDALTEVNNLIKDYEPISTWIDPNSGNSGAEYLVNYIKDGLATKTEIYTVNKLTEENIMSIQKNADGLQTLVASVDKYSVGEYSQAFNLSVEQATSILLPGMIYVPIAHPKTFSHVEAYEYTDESGEIQEFRQEFTPRYYYTWSGGEGDDASAPMWIESDEPTVAFFSEEPAPSSALEYWYVDSNVAPEGYEPYTLYAWLDDKWTKVSTVNGNVNNRIISIIQQTANNITLQLTNTAESVAKINIRLDDNESSVTLLTNWKGEASDSISSLQVISNDHEARITSLTSWKDDNAEGIITTNKWVDENGANTVELIEWKSDNAEGLMAASQWVNDYGAGAEETIKWKNDNAAGLIESKEWIDTNGAGAEETIKWKNDNAEGLIDTKEWVDENGANIEELVEWKDEDGDGLTSSLAKTISEASDNGAKISQIVETVGADGKVTAASITTAITNDESSIQMIADSINLSGYVTFTGLEEGTTTIDGACIKTGYISADRIDVGDLSAFGATIGGWTINKTSLSSSNNAGSMYLYAPSSSATSADAIRVTGKSSGARFYVTYDGVLRATGAIISGEITASSGKIGSWDIDGNGWFSNGNSYIANNQITIMSSPTHTTIQPSTIDLYESATSNVALFASGLRSGNLSTTWSAIINSASDLRVKNSIEILNDNYEHFFDLLVPKRYKYNGGTSDRYHTGFIAQEVVSALEESQLDTTDFAAVMLTNPDTEDECWHLRRDEFVALNTWQIQKLKARVTELENQIAILMNQN